MSLRNGCLRSLITFSSEVFDASVKIFVVIFEISVHSYSFYDLNA